MDLKIIIESNYKTNRRRKIEKKIIEFLAGNPGEQIAFINQADTDF